MIYIVGRAHKASVKDGVGILYQRISKNGIAHAAVIILNIKFYLFSAVSISSFPPNILGYNKIWHPSFESGNLSVYSFPNNLLLKN